VGVEEEEEEEEEEDEEPPSEAIHMLASGMLASGTSLACCLLLQPVWYLTGAIQGSVGMSKKGAYIAV
jgi:hypothetical protein